MSPSVNASPCQWISSENEIVLPLAKEYPPKYIHCHLEPLDAAMSMSTDTVNCILSNEMVLPSGVSHSCVSDPCTWWMSTGVVVPSDISSPCHAWPVLCPQWMLLQHYSDQELPVSMSPVSHTLNVHSITSLCCLTSIKHTECPLYHQPLVSHQSEAQWMFTESPVSHQFHAQ